MGQGGSGQGGDAGGLNVEMSMGPDGVMSALHIPAEECNYAWVNNFTFMNHLVSKKVFPFPRRRGIVFTNGQWLLPMRLKKLRAIILCAKMMQP